MPLDVEKPLELAAKPIRAMTEFNKLLLGLSTGAVVLFINIVISLHSARWISAFLVISAISFGVAAVCCLRLLMRIIEIETIMVEAIQDTAEDWRSKYVPRVVRCTEQTTYNAAALQVFFVTGIAFAALFLLAFWLVH